MTRWWDDVATVVELASLAEDVTRDEAAALRRVAARCDKERSETVSLLDLLEYRPTVTVKTGDVL